MASAVHVFGIRHHGPGSARSLVAALDRLAPDVVLVEGPPDAADALALAGHPALEPPVALLVYAPERPRQAVYYPFARFSPEWQALRWALPRGIPARFIDLPVAHRFAHQDARLAELQAEGAAPAGGEAGASSEMPDGAVAADGAGTGDGGDTDPEVRGDPLDWLGRASGHGDGERWWEGLVETRRTADDVFAAILEAMTALRDELGGDDPWEARREAHMRQAIRAAQREGFARVAVVCGAWHAPALARMPAAKEDAALLKGLPKAKTAATWVPWTYGRLAYASGYGAGVHSPGWYDHLWEQGGAPPSAVAVGWLSRVARLLRAEELDASPAQVVDAARLGEALAALRGLPLAGLPELGEAAEAVFWGGAGSLPMRLIHERLVVGERLGRVPDEVPAVPLQRDLAREQRRLRLPPEAQERVLSLDLRGATDLDRSRLLHRLLLLGIAWGRDERVHGKRGTFHEQWRLRWEPELAVALIEAGAWGNTVAAAADARTRDAAERASELPALTALLDRVLLAELPGAARLLVERIGAEAARASDAAHLMAALPPLAGTLRYGSVRGPDAALLGHVVDGLVARVCVGLLPAVASLDDDAAAAMAGHVDAVHGAVVLLEDERHRADWLAALARVADGRGIHGRVAGRAVRLLLDTGALPADEAARRMGLALSVAGDPAQGAAWTEGFLSGNALALLHDAALWRVLDGWLAALAPAAFTALLPLLRRTFAAFEASERRRLGELARRGPVPVAAVRGDADSSDFDAERAAAVLPLLSLLLGIEEATPATSTAPAER